MRILLATTNKGKIGELRLILEHEPVEIIGLDAAASTNEIETGTTFEENAILKARRYHQLSGLPTIADDSGLEVEALDGAPGVYSARYGGAGATDEAKIAKLLEVMKGVPELGRGARFTCVAAFVWPGGERVFRGEVQGRILDAPRGTYGFGYDPIFLYQPLGKTFAEISSNEKTMISHRGLAFKKMAAWLRESSFLDTPKTGDRIGTTAD